MLIRMLLAMAVPVLLLAQAGDCSQCAGCPEQKPEAEAEHCHWLEVIGLVEGGAAEAAGVQAGDVIQNYNGKAVGCLADLAAHKAEATGDSVAVKVLRGEREVELRFPTGQLGVYLKEWQNDVVPDSDAVIISGVPLLEWEDNQSNTFAGALAAYVKFAGGWADYVFINGVSGAAFRTHFFDGWCPSSAASTCGFDASGPAYTACGLVPRNLEQSTDGKNRPAILAELRAELDAGRPVLGLGLIGEPEYGLITGYQKAGQELFCRTYYDRRKGLELADNFPGHAVILKPSEDAPGPGMSMRRSFAVVHENLVTRQYGSYFSGLAAFDEWLKRLRTEDFTKRDSAGFSEVVATNYWITARMLDDRRSGIEYLGRVAEDMPALAAEMDTLKALYQEETELLAPLVEKLPCPGTCTAPEQWTMEMRNEQAGVIEKVREIEARALPTWDKLAAID
jgi:hypothetical protein